MHGYLMTRHLHVCIEKYHGMAALQRWKWKKTLSKLSHFFWNLCYYSSCYTPFITNMKEKPLNGVAHSNVEDGSSKSATRKGNLAFEVWKIENIEDRKEIHQPRERVALLEDVTFSNVTSGDIKISQHIRSERPARLLPLQLLL